MKLFELLFSYQMSSKLIQVSFVCILFLMVMKLFELLFSYQMSGKLIQVSFVCILFFNGNEAF
jgi:phage shock protein PspC (stress-responsive transcriptional regulator)